MLLREAQHGVDDQKRADDREVGVFPQRRRQHHDELEHPRRDAPELADEHEQRVGPFLGDLVEAFGPPACLHVRAKEPSLRIGEQRCERLFRGYGVALRGRPLGRCWQGLHGAHHHTSLKPTLGMGATPHRPSHVGKEDARDDGPKTCADHGGARCREQFRCGEPLRGERHGRRKKRGYRPWRVRSSKARGRECGKCEGNLHVLPVRLVEPRAPRLEVPTSTPRNLDHKPLAIRDHARRR